MYHFIKRSHIVSFTFITLGLFLTFGLAATAQSDTNTGKIRIDVISAKDKRPLVEAQINITSRNGKQYEIRSDNAGVAVSPSIPPGLYEVHIEYPRFLTSRLPSVRVISRKTSSVTVELSPARNTLEEVVVIGNKTQLDSLSSAGTRYIDREALRSAAGSGSDILRALDGLPGLFSSGEFASFTVRGNGPKDNLILVDDFPFDKVVHFDDSFGEQEDIEGGGRYSVFAPNIINGAEFQPGGWSAAYGGRAGSLLKLEVAEGNPESASYTTRIDIAGIEVGYDGPSHFHDQTSILFSARTQNFGRLFETIGIEDIGTPKNTDIIFKTKSNIGENTTINFLAIYAPEEFERNIDNVLASDEDDPGNYEDIELINSEADNILLGATWSQLIGNSSEWTHRIYYRLFDESTTSGEAFPDLVPIDTPASEVPVRENIIRSSRDETEVGFRSDFKSINNFGEYSLGVRATQYDLAFDLVLDDDWIRYVYDQNDFRDDPDQRFIVLTPESVNNNYEEKSTSYSLYADQVFDFSNWDIRTGIRLGRDSLSDETITSPRFGLNWQANDRTRFSATIGRYAQSPRFIDRANDASNRGLENEIIDQVSVGMNYLLSDNIELLIEPYYQDLDNLVVETDGVSQTANNAGEGRSFGVDTAITKRFINGWSANMNYSYNKAEVKDAPSLDFYDADFNRTHSFSLGSVWEINDRWKLSGRWKWASGTPKDAFIIHDNVLGDGQPLRFSKENITTNTERFENFHSLNFRVDYRRTFGNTSIIAFLDVINAYGADNPSSTEFNERSGEDAIEDGDSIPLIGFRLEW